jgi:hypothetical protein
MMKLGFLTAVLPYRIRADNEVYHADGYGGGRSQPESAGRSAPACSPHCSSHDVYRLGSVFAI